LNFNVDNSGTGGAGLGMQVLGVSAELRYFIPVDLIKTNSGFLHSQYHAIAFVVGYKLFTARKMNGI
jgi:hypothetical protein